MSYLSLFVYPLHLPKEPLVPVAVKIAHGTRPERPSIVYKMTWEAPGHQEGGDRADVGRHFFLLLFLFDGNLSTEYGIWRTKKIISYGKLRRRPMPDAWSVYKLP